MLMKKIMIMMSAALLLTGCGLYNKYERPDVNAEGLVRDPLSITDTLALQDTTSFGYMPWRSVFTDHQLQALIQQGLDNNPDLLNAALNVKMMEAALTVAKLSFLPSVAISPRGTLSSFNGVKTNAYTLPVSASWNVDLFGNLLSVKRSAQMQLLGMQDYQNVVKINIISGIANLYYTLLMLDAQLATTRQTIEIWQKNVEVMGYMMHAGMANGAAVSQYKANLLNLQAGVPQLEASIAQAENTLCYILHEAPHPIARAKTFYTSGMPSLFSVGIPLQLLQNRPDVRIAELQMAYAFYGRNKAEAAFYPSITLNGTLGWTNSGGMGITNPGKVLTTLIGQLTQPIFAKGQLNANLRISESEQRRAQLNFEDALLQAGQEVSNYLKDYQTAIDQHAWYEQQVKQLETARDQTAALFAHGNSTTYLEKLTAEQSLLSAQLALINAKHARVQAMINLYCALGGGREDLH